MIHKMRRVVASWWLLVIPATGEFEQWTRADGASAKLELQELRMEKEQWVAQFRSQSGKTHKIPLSDLNEESRNRANLWSFWGASISINDEKWGDGGPVPPENVARFVFNMKLKDRVDLSDDYKLHGGRSVSFLVQDFEAKDESGDILKFDSCRVTLISDPFVNSSYDVVANLSGRNSEKLIRSKDLKFRLVLDFKKHGSLPVVFDMKNASNTGF